MTLCTRQDRFDKADAAFRQACSDVSESYAIWSDACDRLMRLNKERLKAWRELVAVVSDGEHVTEKEG